MGDIIVHPSSTTGPKDAGLIAAPSSNLGTASGSLKTLTVL
jgi:hypothetical protein